MNKNPKGNPVNLSRPLWMIFLTTIILSVTITSQTQPEESEFKLSRISPAKVFTPNGDGINDEVNFVFENPGESIVTGSVYDIAGAYVADLAWSGDNVSLKWDGRDRGGSFAREGIYVYQIKAEGKVINGTVVVAR